MCYGHGRLLCWQEEKFEKVVMVMVDEWIAEIAAVKELAKQWAVARVKFDHYKEKVDGTAVRGIAT